jgi:hypothetical protein
MVCVMASCNASIVSKLRLAKARLNSKNHRSTGLSCAL